MILECLKAYNYRNLAATELSWNEKFNVVYGSNAQGKTNLLEAIYLFGHLKSFRNARGSDLIRHNAETARLNATIKRHKVRHQLEITLAKAGRTPKINGKTVQKLTQFLGHLRTVIFTPEELGIIKGYPAGRRALLDRAILQTDPTYLERVQEFDRVLRQRNQLLKQQSSFKELIPWNSAFVRTGGIIRYERINYLERFRSQLRLVYKEITGGTETADVHYSVAPGALQCLTEQLATDLDKNYQREQKLGLTLAGPHRDDLEFLVDDRLLRTFGSQGQQRSFLLAFKAAQVVDLEKQLKESPILLLDDLASELDASRQEGFFSFLLQRQSQVFLTAAQLPKLAISVRQTASYFKVDQGMIFLTTPE